MDAVALFEAVRTGAAGLLIAIGAAFMAGGAIGVLRFPDFYTRLHATGVADAVGALFVLAGLAVATASAAIVVKLLLLAGLVAALAPTLAHLTANAAHAAGLSPLAGQYQAPRPGAKRPDAQP